MAIFTHVVLGTNDIEKARKFYDSTLGALGLKRVMNMDNASLWGKDGPEFMVTKPANGNAATAANGGTIGFAAADRPAVHAFHKAALEAGGTCEGPPGPRDFTQTAYAAYVRDLDGNKLTAYTFVPG